MLLATRSLLIYCLTFQDAEILFLLLEIPLIYLLKCSLMTQQTEQPQTLTSRQQTIRQPQCFRGL